jgi:hypothetical protein
VELSNDAPERIRQAYQPVRSDSTFEFTVEHVGEHDGNAMAFGLVTKGVLHEGYRLHLFRGCSEQRECVCKAIAGSSKRLPKASTEDLYKNVGIWLDVPPRDSKPHDRLVSFDTPAAARQVTPASFGFSILHGVQK